MFSYRGTLAHSAVSDTGFWRDQKCSSIIKVCRVSWDFAKKKLPPTDVFCRRNIATQLHPSHHCECTRAWVSDTPIRMGIWHELLLLTHHNPLLYVTHIVYPPLRNVFWTERPPLPFKNKFKTIPCSFVYPPYTHTHVSFVYPPYTHTHMYIRVHTCTSLQGVCTHISTS